MVVWWERSGWASVRKDERRDVADAERKRIDLPGRSYDAARFNTRAREFQWGPENAGLSACAVLAAPFSLCLAPVAGTDEAAVVTPPLGMVSGWAQRYVPLNASV
jgi:hypothetical protein